MIIFFAKTLEQVRPGGVIAYITSKGTMDKASSDVRRYIAQKAELLGAIRLPNTAFAANAGTSVTTDILFAETGKPNRHRAGLGASGADRGRNSHQQLLCQPSRYDAGQHGMG